MHASAPLVRQHGFALIEALVSMLVLAGGMLGMAGFEANLSRNSDLAWYLCGCGADSATAPRSTFGPSFEINLVVERRYHCTARDRGQ